MRTLSLIRGIPIFDENTGMKLGEVCDVHISSNKVSSLLLKKGMVVKKTLQVDLSHVSSFGSDGIIVDGRYAIRPYQKTSEPSFTCGLAGKMLLSSDGDKLGLIEDVYFKEELGTIVGYECSDGFFSDISEGKRIVQTDDPLYQGKDAIIVNVKQKCSDKC